MFEEYLGKDESESIFRAGMRQFEMEKKSVSLAGLQAILPIIENIGKDIKGVGSTLFSMGGKAVDAVTKIPPTLGNIMMLGGGTGLLGTMAYHTIKDNISKDDPREKLNRKIERLYEMKTREAEDARWMDRVRSMRDELRRGYKKMSTEEYGKKYDELVKALAERGS